jgi:hypothetical protein
LDSQPWHLGLLKIGKIETRSLPTLARCYRRSFAFYVTHPIRSILSFTFLVPVRSAGRTDSSRGELGLASKPEHKVALRDLRREPFAPFQEFILELGTRQDLPDSYETQIARIMNSAEIDLPNFKSRINKILLILSFYICKPVKTSAPINVTIETRLSALAKSRCIRARRARES